MTGHEPQVDQAVTHARHGRGRIIALDAGLAVVRFEGSIEQVPVEELNLAASPGQGGGKFGDPLDAVTRAQALAIRSVNDQWGVFTRSRIQLLPHQLWVCQRITQRWPFRWLVADDVGLGKTIEAGLVLMPLIASGRIKRVLVLAPAKLVPQWQQRLKDMFDVRLLQYAPTIAKSGDFWGTASTVVASYHTLRSDRSQARSKLLDADRWDLVIVDEAHHLGTDEKKGQTLGYELLAELQERQKVESLLFFTATPHRGKDYGFLGLMHLVRPDLFDPDGDPDEQYERLGEAMLRNNKATVTDLKGNKLFTPVFVTTREYSYSEAEDLFYRTLSTFIVDGKTYAAKLDGRAQTARMLVLITLQKLAASSIAAIRHALANRQESLSNLVDKDIEPAELAVIESDDTEADERSEAEEKLSAAAILLMQDEIDRIGELLELADRVDVETKIHRILDLLETDLEPDTQVLFFTEYKATQALVINALERKFGSGSATFINGDERLRGLTTASGLIETRQIKREAAAAGFNSGQFRFLVSTEAGGEGIDLQERCCTLVHVDMPWNPMRLHQRVGRLSRYGQTKDVNVFILRNPETVESRIWDLLYSKLERVQAALSATMAEREDIMQLVIGMAGNAALERVFAEAPAKGAEGLKGYFDQAAGTIAGEDVVAAARRIFSDVGRFDFQQVGKDLPQVDLPALEPFLLNALSRHGRRVFRREDGLEVKSPDEWHKQDWAILERYERLVFDRSIKGKNTTTRVLGIGHRLIDKALDEATTLPVASTVVAGLAGAVLVAAVEDQVTGTGASIRRIIVGAREVGDKIDVLKDWELLQLLNGLTVRTTSTSLGQQTAEHGDVQRRLENAIDDRLTDIASDMRRPRRWSELVLLPGASDGVGRSEV